MFRIPHWPVSYSTQPLADAVLYISTANFDFLTMSGRVEVVIYEDEAAANANLEPIARFGYPIPATPTVGETGFTLPPLSELIAGNQGVFNSLMTVFYGLVTGDPRFAGASPVAPGAG